jgi:hypothetical protein
MAVASVVASICGIAIGSRSGLGGAVVGAIAGVVAAGVAVFLVNAVLMLLSGILGRNPREIQNGIFALATWGVAVLAILAAVGALIRLY